MSEDSSHSPENDSRFKRRTSAHNLKLDVAKAVTAAETGSYPISYPCNPSQNVDQLFDTQVGQVRDPEVVEEGKQLFRNFIREEIKREGLLEPAKCFSPLCR